MINVGQIVPGDRLLYRGMTLGWVEKALLDESSGELLAVLLRSGRADYLLRVPGSCVATPATCRRGRPWCPTAEAPSCVCLKEDVEFDDLERLAVESGVTPPIGEHFTDGGPTEPSPSPSQVLVGHQPGFPEAYDEPSTG